MSVKNCFFVYFFVFLQMFEWYYCIKNNALSSLQTFQYAGHIASQSTLLRAILTLPLEWVEVQISFKNKKKLTKYIIFLQLSFKTFLNKHKNDKKLPSPFNFWILCLNVSPQQVHLHYYDSFIPAWTAYHQYGATCTRCMKHYSYNLVAV